MIISNVSTVTLYYNVRDQSGQFNDSGSINAKSYVDFQPRGQAPFQITAQSVTLTSVPSSAIVTLWGSASGSFSQ